MALSGSTIAECRTGGDDTNNGGLFDPSKVSGGGFTDGAATSATGSSPVFSSVSYTFLAGDVGAQVYIDSGTNWTSGWYPIASVAGGNATLSAAIGQAVLANNTGLNTVAGCATVASPSSAKWSIDYSQQTGAQFTYTDISSTGVGLTASSSAHAFGKQQVGNSIVVTGGTNFTAGRYVLASVSGTTGTFVGAANLHTAAGTNSDGAGGMGGAVKSPAIASSVMVSGNKGFIRNDGVTFSMTSATQNVANGTISGIGIVFYGYATNRTVVNTDSKPTIQVNVASATVVNSACVVNLILDGNSQTSASPTNAGTLEHCTLKNFTAASAGAAIFRRCYATTNSANMFVGQCYGCEATANTATPFSAVMTSRCLSYGNTGASTDGFFLGGSGAVLADSSAYGNGRDGVRVSNNRAAVENVHSEANTGAGFNVTSTFGFLKTCTAFGNTGGPTSGSPIADPAVVSLASSAFTNAAGGDFSLNNTASAGASLRAAGSIGIFPGALTTGYGDIGAAQHADPSATLPRSRVFSGF